MAVVEGRPGLRIHRLEVSPSARARAPAERARYRSDRFAAYFAGAHRFELEAEQLILLAPPGGRLCSKISGASPLLQRNMLRREDLVGLLIGLHDSANETIGLGICEDVSRDNRYIYVRTPVAAESAIRILQLGNVYLDERDERVAQREENPL